MESNVEILMRLWRVDHFRLMSVIGCILMLSRCVLSLSEEGRLLLSWKENLADVDNYLGNWNASDATPCLWNGVSCTDQGSISAINLSTFWTLTGLLPDQTFGKFADLTTLEIHNLTGVFPRDVVNCSKLVTLNLSWSYTSGPVPAEISNLKQLQVLDLSYAEFNGTVSNSSIGELQQLRALCLHSNYFVGAIPESITSLRNLQQLTLSGNLWTGTLPAGIFKLPNLRVCWLGDLIDAVPYALPDLSAWPKMESLRLRDIQFPQSPFPSGVENMTNLWKLHIALCNLTGPIPSFLQKLTQLQEITLENNTLSGDLPDMFGAMPNLRLLYLNMNQLTGRIPASLWHCTKLAEFFLYGNDFQGDIAGIGNFTGLTRLDISRNFFTGPIPPALGNLTRLTQLNLSWNNFSGEIPPGVADWEDIFEFRFKNNQITGVIPYTLGTKAIFKWVDFGSNMLHGPIPPNLCRGNVLAYFSAKSNMLTGSIPETYGNCTSLVTFWAANNRLEGSLGGAAGMFDMSPDLAYVSIANNNFSGSLPVFARRNSGLQLIDFSGNKFTGDIPTELNSSDLAELRVLMLSKNQLQGSVPTWIGNLQNLQVLDLSHNKLTQFIPTDFGNLDGFKVSARDNGVAAFDNTIPYSLAFDLNITIGDLTTPHSYILRATTSMDLSSNALNGSIPSSMLKLVSIVYLILSDNDLEGEIPPGFANLTHLEVLYLDQNKLTGAVPPQLPSSVRQFNVSLNNLSGEVPEGGQFDTFTNASYLPGNEGLCGEVVNKACNVTYQEPSPQPSAALLDEQLQASDIISSAAVGIGVGIGFFGVLLVSLVWTRARFVLFGSFWGPPKMEGGFVINHMEFNPATSDELKIHYSDRYQNPKLIK